MLNKKLRILSTAILTVGVGLGVVSCGDPSTSTTGTQGTDETKQTTEEYTTSVDTQALLDAYAEAAVTEINAVSEEEKTLSMGCSTEDEAFVRTVIEDFKTKKPRLLTPIECERINGFPDNWTNTGMTQKKRNFMMGNALVVGVIEKIGEEIEKIIDNEK